MKLKSQQVSSGRDSTQHTTQADVASSTNLIRSSQRRESWSSQRVQLVDTSSGCDVRTGVGGSPRATGRAKQQARKQTVTNVNRNNPLLSRAAQRALRLMEVLAPSRRQMDKNVLSIFRTRTLDTSLVLDVAR